jgi:hypothetical protein
MLPKSAVDVATGALAVGMEAGIAPPMVAVVPISRRVASSLKSLPMPNAGRRKAESTEVRITSGGISSSAANNSCSEYCRWFGVGEGLRLDRKG